LSEQARTSIQAAVKAHPLVLFMKGTPKMPQCGFSRAVVQLLELHDVPSDKIKTYNCLEDNELRQSIKEFRLVLSIENLSTLSRLRQLLIPILFLTIFFFIVNGLPSRRFISMENSWGDVI
jgi:glutaredoxin-related protein